MDEKELQRLYNAVNSKFDIGDFGSFRTRMQTPEDRRKFYDAVGGKGFDLGDYNFYEERLSGVKKKPDTSVGSIPSGSGVSNVQDTQDKGLQAYLEARSKERKEGAAYRDINTDSQAISTATTLPRKTEVQIAKQSAPSKESLEKENKEFRQQALATTAKRSKRTEAEVQNDVDEGKLILSSDRSGNKIYARQPGAGETFIRGLSNSIQSLADASTIGYVKATGSPEELAALYEMISLRKRQEAEKEYGLQDLLSTQSAFPTDKEVVGLPTAAPGVVGTLTEMGGHLAPDIAMAAGTGGLSSVAKTGIIGSKMYASSYGNKAYELYERGKEEAIKAGMDEKQASILAAQAATENAATAAIPDAALNTAFFSGKLHSPAANNFVSVVKGAVKDAVKVGALGAAASGTTAAIESGQGYDVDNIINNMIESGGEFAKLDLLFKVLPILRTLPKATQSAVKEFAVDPVIKPLVEQQLKTLNEEIANNIRNDLAAYEAATKDIRGIVPEEKMASLGGRMQKRQNRLNGINIIKKDITDLEVKKQNLPEPLHEEIDVTIKEREGQIKELEKEVEGIDKEIADINKSKGTGLEKEVDEATGEPIIPKEEKITEPEQPVSTQPSGVSEGADKVGEQTKPIQDESINQPIPEEAVTGERVSEPIKAEQVEQTEAEVPKAGEGAGGEPPKGGAAEVTIFSEPKRTVFSHRGLQEVATEFGLNDITSRERVSDLQLFRGADETINKWVSEGTYQKKIDGLIEKAKAGEIFSPEQNVIMAQHIAQMRDKATQVRSQFGINSPEYNAALKDLQGITTVGQKVRSDIGAALRVPTLSREYMPTLEDAMTAKMEAVGSDILTEKQKADVEKQFETIQKERDEYKAKWEEAQAKFTEMQAQSELSKPASKGKTTAAKRDYKAERQSLKDRLKQEIADYKAAGQKMGIASDGGAESFKISAKIAKTITEIARTHVAEVGVKIKEVVEKTLEDVREYFGDNVSEKDIMDVLAGKYNEKRKTRSQLAADMKEVQTEAKLLQEYQRLLEGGEPKNEKRKIERNQRLSQLRSEIKSLEEFGKAEEDAKLKLQQEQASELNKKLSYKTPAEAAAQRAIEANKKKEEQIREKIANKDFQETKKPETFWQDPSFKKSNPDLYKQVLDSYTKKEEAQLEYELELLKDVEAKKGKGQKFLDWLGRGANTTKKVVTGIDDSSLFMQTLAAMTARPLIAAKAVKLHALDAVSKKRFDRTLAELHNSPDWDLMQKSGLDVTEPKSLTAAKHEEAFAGKTWDATVKIKGKEYQVLQTLLSPFERAFTSLGNGMRVIAFRTLAEKFQKEGHTFENNPQLFKDLATMLNTETGRGKQNELVERASNLVTKGIWSPRLMASRINMLGIADALSLIPGMEKAGTKGYYRQLTPEIRKEALKDLVSFSTTVMALSYLTSYAIGGELDDDPNSVTFLDIKTPDGKSYNISGGFAQYIKLVSQTIRGGKTKEGQFNEFNRNTDRGGNILRFGRGKLTPMAGVFTDVLTGKDFMGEEVTPLGEAKKLAIPLSLQNVSKDIKDGGLSSLFTSTLPSFVGIQVKDEKDFQKSTGQKKEKQEKKEKKPKPEKSY